MSEKGSGKVNLGIIISLFFLLLGAGWYWFFKTTDISGKVVSHSWENTCRFEELEWVKREGWSLPSGARKVKKIQKTTGKNTSNGKEEIKTYYTYEVQKWTDDGDYSTSGNGTTTSWSEKCLAEEADLDQDERIFKESAYWIHFKGSDGDNYTSRETDRVSWKKISEGDAYLLKVNNAGMVLNKTVR